MKPWKYIGYRGYSNFIASDADFLLLRRFASSNTRTALMLQDQVALTEKELEELDRRYSRKDVEDVHNGCFRGDQEDRERLLQELKSKLTEYSEFIPSSSKFQRCPMTYTPFVRYIHPPASRAQEVSSCVKESRRQCTKLARKPWQPRDSTRRTRIPKP